LGIAAVRVITDEDAGNPGRIGNLRRRGRVGMDATTPFCRWLRVAGLLVLAAAGCRTSDAKPAAAGRGQVPADPLAPISHAPVPGQPVAPAVVAGQPVTSAPPAVAGQAVQVGYSTERDVKPVLPDGTPRIKVVAQVGAGNIITDEEVWESVRHRVKDYVKESADGRGMVRDPDKERVVYAEELKRLIERELILEEMYARLKKAPKGAQTIEEIKESTTKMVDRQLREMRRRIGMRTEDEFREFLASQGLSLPGFRRQMERQLMAEQYIHTMIKEKGTSVGLAEVRAYFDGHPDEFRTPDRVKWLHIFVSSNRFPTPQAAYDYAAAVQQKAAAGGDFAALSEQYDHGLAGRQQGDKKGVGLGQERGKIQPADLEPTIWALQVGQVSGLVETAAGYHIVKVVERDVAGLRPFDDKTQTEIRHKLMGKLFEQEQRRLVESLWWRGVVDVVEKPTLPPAEATVVKQSSK
jgi:hypothetical protein